jgi:hypothetical protein
MAKTKWENYQSAKRAWEQENDLIREKYSPGDATGSSGTGGVVY